MPDTENKTIDLAPPTHATYDVSKIIVAELILEELLPTFTTQQLKKVVDILEVLDFEVTIKENTNA